MQSIIGWIALVVFVYVLGAQFYVYYAVRRLFARIRRESASASDEGSAVERLSARAKLKWLRDNRTNIPGNVLPDVRRVLLLDTLSVVLFGVLVLLWVVGMTVR